STLTNVTEYILDFALETPSDTRVGFLQYSGPTADVSVPTLGAEVNVTQSKAVLYAVLVEMLGIRGSNDLALAIDFVREGMLLPQENRAGSDRIVVFVLFSDPSDSFGFETALARASAQSAMAALKAEDDPFVVVLNVGGALSPGFLAAQADA